jgi:hypothetical protein
MLDVFYVAVGCAFLFVCWAFTKACDKLYEAVSKTASLTVAAL